MKESLIKLDTLLSIDQSERHFEGLDDGRSHLQYRLIFGIGATFVGSFALISASNGSHVLTAVLSICLVFVLLVNFLIVRTGNLRIGGWLYSAALVSLVLFLNWHSGVALTGHLWAYPITVIIISLLGHANGILMVLVMITLSALMMGGGIPVTPRVEFLPSYLFRYHATLLALAGLAWGIEYSRAKAYRHMRDSNQKLEQVSRTDQLTGILNRRGILEHYTAETNRFSRSGETFTMLLIDVDDFKLINDQRGHATGDQILCELAELMQTEIRTTDTLGRWGGEEFLILLSQTPEEEGLVIAKKLRQSVEENQNFADGQVRKLTISVGLASYRVNLALLEMADLADKALYAAKNAGENRVMSA